MNKQGKPDLENIEISLLLEGIYKQYGFDFRDYSPASMKRRIKKSVEDEGVSTISGFQEKVLRDPSCMTRFIDNMSISVTSMFRDPELYQAFRKKIIPGLRSSSFIRIWHAGCATGEEVYSMAILLKEEGLLEKTRIYATDMNEIVLNKAKEGIFPLKHMQEYTNNYIGAGGHESLSNYYLAKHNRVIFNKEIKNKITWAEHNLVTDGSFNEFDVIVCRNVMIYFNEELRNHVLKLFYDSLPMNGIFILGSKENIRFSPYENNYAEVDAKWKIYKKIS
ncbi:MAG: protein-glutamate O-methyltransferase CheR [Prolixibacteraceae bacterium]